jgi:tetrapyrrole methylase family protein/MazG family protein
MAVGDAFARLVEIMERLRAPGGCPWDREQTHQSIKPYLIEEAYEVAEAIEKNDSDELRTELGDLLLQIVFHSTMAREAGVFTIEDVIGAITDKMVRRHPHVFGDVQVKDAAEVLNNWSRIKAAERVNSEDRSAIAGVPRGMPALLRAARLGEKASHVGFDWQRPEEVLEKVREELGELDQALASGDRAATEAELGDVLLALTSLARRADLNAEDALARAADRFSHRFRQMEAFFHAQGRDLRDVPLSEQEAAWQRIKNSC